jgi:hypothetical protein
MEIDCEHEFEDNRFQYRSNVDTNDDTAEMRRCVACGNVDVDASRLTSKKRDYFGNDLLQFLCLSLNTVLNDIYLF